MKTFACCCQDRPVLFFENTTCNRCARLVGYTDDFEDIVPFDEAGGLYTTPYYPDRQFVRCNNAIHYGICNGFISVNEPANSLCFACRFNKTIPDLSVAAHLPLWHKLEIAKRRALKTLVSLKLPLRPFFESADGISFEFMADSQADGHFESSLAAATPVMTGHSAGNITINLAEADDVARSKTQHKMGERYRTLLGHFRHELGHYFFAVLFAEESKDLQLCRSLFGDEREDYQAALNAYYASDTKSNWQSEYISTYASMHPAEDWAECWAHYMHIIDTLDTAQNAGINLERHHRSEDSVVSPTELTLPQNDFFRKQTEFSEIIKTWMRFSVVINSLNRSMGLPDAYPFTLSETVQKKLRFIHMAIHRSLDI